MRPCWAPTSRGLERAGLGGREGLGGRAAEVGRRPACNSALLLSRNPAPRAQSTLPPPVTCVQVADGTGGAPGGAVPCDAKQQREGQRRAHAVRNHRRRLLRRVRRGAQLVRRAECRTLFQWLWLTAQCGKRGQRCTDARLGSSCPLSIDAAVLLRHGLRCSTVWIFCGQEEGCNNGYNDTAPFGGCALRQQDIPPDLLNGGRRRGGVAGAGVDVLVVRACWPSMRRVLARGFPLHVRFQCASDAPLPSSRVFHFLLGARHCQHLPIPTRLYGKLGWAQPCLTERGSSAGAAAAGRRASATAPVLLERRLCSRCRAASGVARLL